MEFNSTFLKLTSHMQPFPSTLLAAKPLFDSLKDLHVYELSVSNSTKVQEAVNKVFERHRSKKFTADVHSLTAEQSHIYTAHPVRPWEIMFCLVTITFNDHPQLVPLQFSS